MFKTAFTPWAVRWAAAARVAIPLGLAALLYVAWARWGAMGLAAVAGGIVMWLLLHITRVLHIMRRAARTPIGWVGSAVMLNARLKVGVPLLHVVALTRALGQPLDEAGREVGIEQQGAEGGKNQIFRWRDNSHSHVTCYFENGRLVQWQLFRPDMQGQENNSSNNQSNNQINNL